MAYKAILDKNNPCPECNGCWRYRRSGNCVACARQNASFNSHGSGPQIDYTPRINTILESELMMGVNYTE